jgi:exopolysaccharide biosynthesis polyprenyl glycosylphosphotransferase
MTDVVLDDVRKVDTAGPDGVIAGPHLVHTAGKPAGRAGRWDLRLLLVSLDVAMVGAAWMTVLALVGARFDAWNWVGTRALPLSVGMAVLTPGLAWTQRLYQARVCALRSSEISRLCRVTLISGLIALGVARYGHLLEPWMVLSGTGAAFCAMAMGRSMYSGWLRLHRAQGDFGRPVCVVGTNEEAEDLVHLLRDHPELGYQVMAVVGDYAEWRNRIPDVPVAPITSDPAATVRAHGATGVLVAATALNAVGRDRMIARLIDDGIHVQMSAGLSRLGHSRLRICPLAHQLAFYVEPTQLSAGQFFIKRCLDLGLASVVLALTWPLIAVAAVLIKLEDRGPIIYRQERVGLGGRTFPLLKLRTMVPGAGRMLADLKALNERQGPLFKLTSDPRVTRVGRFLRTSSIDELPQLLNVIKGEMSLVGPRPALPSEYAQFDPDLVCRTRVLPGITGLWQVEARDNPSFRVYRRLDLFYVDNWSIAFDLAIMVRTARMLSVRTVGTIWGLVRGATAPVAKADRPELQLLNGPAPEAG